MVELKSNNGDFGRFNGKRLLVLAAGYPDASNSYNGGMFVKNQLDVLKKYFEEIIVISPVLYSSKFLPDDKLCQDYFYDNIRVYYPRCFYIPWPLVDKLNLRRILIDNRFHAIHNLIKKENIKFDLIHAHFTWPSAYIGVKLKKEYNVPVVSTIHENSDWFNREFELNLPYIELSWKCSDALIRVNNRDVPRLKKFNSSVYSIPNGYSTRFKPMDQAVCRKNLNLLPIDKKIIFSLGGLIERKGFAHLIDAMKIVKKQRNDVICFIGGTGPLMNVLNKNIEDQYLSDSIKLLGYLPDSQVSLWMNACDIFVLPSLGEGNPTVMFECLGCGRPFVGTDVGGVSEVICSEKYGLVCRPGDAENLAEKILISLDRDWNYVSIREYAERYSWENIVKQILCVYSVCLQNGDQFNDSG